MIKYKYIPFDFGKKTYGHVDTNSTFGNPTELSSTSLLFQGSSTLQKNGISPTGQHGPASNSLPHYVPPVPYSFRDSQY